MNSQNIIIIYYFSKISKYLESKITEESDIFVSIYKKITTTL